MVGRHTAECSVFNGQLERVFTLPLPVRLTSFVSKETTLRDAQFVSRSAHFPCLSPRFSLPGTQWARNSHGRRFLFFQSLFCQNSSKKFTCFHMHFLFLLSIIVCNFISNFFLQLRKLQSYNDFQWIITILLHFCSKAERKHAKKSCKSSPHANEMWGVSHFFLTRLLHLPPGRYPLWAYRAGDAVVSHNAIALHRSTFVQLFDFPSDCIKLLAFYYASQNTNGR